MSTLINELFATDDFCENIESAFNTPTDLSRLVRLPSDYHDRTVEKINGKLEASE